MKCSMYIFSAIAMIIDNSDVVFAQGITIGIPSDTSYITAREGNGVNLSMFNRSTQSRLQQVISAEALRKVSPNGGYISYIDIRFDGSFNKG